MLKTLGLCLVAAVLTYWLTIIAYAVIVNFVYLFLCIAQYV